MHNFEKKMKSVTTQKKTNFALQAISRFSANHKKFTYLDSSTQKLVQSWNYEAHGTIIMHKICTKIAALDWKTKRHDYSQTDIINS